MSAVDELTPKQKAFAEIYVSQFMCNKTKATEAARLAGYKDTKALAAQTSRMLKNVKLVAYINELTTTTTSYIKHQEADQQRQIDINEEYRKSLTFLVRLRNGEEKDQFGLEPLLKDRLTATKELIRIKERMDLLNTKANDNNNINNGGGMFLITPVYGTPEETDNGDAEE